MFRNLSVFFSVLFLSITALASDQNYDFSGKWVFNISTGEVVDFIELKKTEEPYKATVLLPLMQDTDTFGNLLKRTKVKRVSPTQILVTARGETPMEFTDNGTACSTASELVIKVSATIDGKTFAKEHPAYFHAKAIYRCSRGHRETETVLFDRTAELPCVLSKP